MDNGEVIQQFVLQIGQYHGCNVRQTYNEAERILCRPNTQGAMKPLIQALGGIDILSNGFKLRETSAKFYNFKLATPTSSPPSLSIHSAAPVFRPPLLARI
jgi:hypothetical protein